MLCGRSPAADPWNLPAIVLSLDQNRWLRQIVLFALRGASNLSKFALAIYTARYLGLADLGTYGLLVGAATIAPAALGFGLTDWIGRQIVGLKAADAMPLIATRLTLSLLVHLIGWMLALSGSALLGLSIPAFVILLVAPLLLLEQLTSETEDLLIMRGHIFPSQLLTFLRSGVWPPFVIVWGLLDPAARSIEHLLGGWLAALIGIWLLLLPTLLFHNRWRKLGWRWSWLFQSFRSSLPFYLRDIGVVGGIYLDRFLVTLFLGLELTGVYTFFWSVANVLHTLVLHGMLQNHLRQLVVAGRSEDPNRLKRLERRLQIETVIWCLLLAVLAAVATYLILALIGRPLLQEYFWLFGLILLATLVRVAADGYGYMLLALRRDFAIAAISLAGVAISALLNVVLIPLAGLFGAGAAYLLTSGSLLAARLRIRLKH